MPPPPPPAPLQFDIDVQNPDESNNRPNGTYSRCSSLASPAMLAGSSETSNISAIVATDQTNPLYRPNRPEPSSSNVLRLHMAVLHFSTNASTLREFQQTLPIYSSQQLVSPHTKPTSLVGTVGAADILDKTDPLSSSISDILIFLQKSLTKA